MKMPEKHDLLAAILAAKGQGIGNHTFTAMPMANATGVTFIPSSNRRSSVRHYRLIQFMVFSTMRISSNLLI